jgi:hypothetical protein
MKNSIKYKSIILFFLPIMSFNIAQDDTPKLYVMALRAHLLNVQRNIQNQIESKEYAGKTIFLINDCGVELPMKLDMHELQSLRDSSKISIGERILAIKLNPITVDRGHIVIVLSDYLVSKDGDEAKLSYAGGAKYIFAYNLESRNYKIVHRMALSF